MLCVFRIYCNHCVVYIPFLTFIIMYYRVTKGHKVERSRPIYNKFAIEQVKQTALGQRPNMK